ncbi:MAG: acetyl-CoA acetyltransferase [Actinobacteria bacterium]|nr:acetyl-CoA acetyltransferase [Actinomycetota bacterium]
MDDDPWRTPVIVASAQHSERNEIVTPIGLTEFVAVEALGNAPGISDHIDRVNVVGILFGGGEAPASLLAARLHLDVSDCATTTIGENTPQWLVGRAADDIAAGRADAVLIAGTETVRSQGLGAMTPPDPGRDPDPVDGDARPGVSLEEIAVGLELPAQVYPLFESVLAARAGHTNDEQRRVLGEIMTRFSAVGAAHPHAWFAERLDAAAIAAPAPDNRIVAEPYTKRMNAFLGVDQGAAVVVTSLGRALELGLGDQVVFVWSAADANEVWFPSQRPDLGRSEGIKEARTAVLDASGVDLDDISSFDLYSCFPSAVQLAAAALGLDPLDGRGLTVTGGLPYYGGPGNNYTTHAIATMADELREGATDRLGLVSGLGWFITKHSIGLYGASPPPRGYRRGNTSAAQSRIDASAIPTLDSATGECAVVEASTVIYDRGGPVTAAPVIARVHDGRRIAARAASAELPTPSGCSLVGATVRVDGRRPSHHVVELALGNVSS